MLIDWEGILFMTYESIVNTLQEREPLPVLCPQEIWNKQLSSAIESIDDQELIGREGSSLAIKAVRSGLLLWNDDLYASHTISQDIPEAVGSYWHGIMHRREADFSNAKYWFSKVGAHSVYQEVYEQAIHIYEPIEHWGTWDTHRFVDLVEKATSQNDHKLSQALEQIQAIELELLLQHCRTL
jgi:hypothetical protein